MRRAIAVAAGVLAWAAMAVSGLADSTWEFRVQVSASVQVTPAQITLNWPQDTYMLPSSYTVFRKAPGASSWGSGVPLPGTATTYTDVNVVAGVTYEYQVVKKTTLYSGYGYVYAGINVPAIENLSLIHISEP